VPEAAQMSSYAAWYKTTYPDRVLALSAMSGDRVVTADNAGTVRLWETGVANLERSMQVPDAKLERSITGTGANLERSIQVPDAKLERSIGTEGKSGAEHAGTRCKT
jgi:hypothetical protein